MTQKDHHQSTIHVSSTNILYSIVKITSNKFKYSRLSITFYYNKYYSAKKSHNVPPDIMANPGENVYSDPYKHGILQIVF